MAKAGCPCHGDLRQRLSGTRRGDLLVAWTASWDAGRPWRGVHVVFSHETPTEGRAGLGWAVCACEPGSTRVGRGWAVIYGCDDAALSSAYESVPEPNVLLLLFPGVDATAAAVVEIQRTAEEQGRQLVVQSFDLPKTVRLPRNGAPPLAT